MAQFYPRQAPEPLPETPNPPTLTSWSQQLIQVHQILAHQAQSTNILQSATAARNHLEVMRTSNQLLATQGFAGFERRLQGQLDIITNQLQLQQRKCNTSAGQQEEPIPCTLCKLPNFLSPSNSSHHHHQSISSHTLLYDQHKPAIEAVQIKSRQGDLPPSNVKEIKLAAGALPENRFNLSLIAYGQTSLDKFFTLGSNNNPTNSNGSIPKTLEHLFVNMASLSQKNNQEMVKLLGSFIEIYNQEIIDLLL
ncbi:uncharacterized protein PGTG_18653 [Puccinia graminis f. sp. tritici CRL 75-36-700-3]|uniref:Kinesin motor domain-containing protein n=1 Tax=Puccinia graminis f. sp. tritici (strain CRL 75-36-700-3 / race SCCL) TaxID=418459 RepID=E3L894_PUCGT|nr:uncharacterized protein PGTG_18653 [Puccinia graminis f. sp. tritici CRL 75-36-700-3]EFP92769.1 hypothetical protein PGTG_18653 [Puccinia graminis f. sp. tritici CRL 75-36-700-3]